MDNIHAIRPFLTEIEDLLDDADVTEIMVNDGGRRIFVERHGLCHPVIGRTIPAARLTTAITNIAHALSLSLTAQQPLLDARLDDGSRVAAALDRASVTGPILTIRKFPHRYTLADLVDNGTVAPDVAEALIQDVRARRTLLLCGVAGGGKTTLLNALVAYLPPQDRVVVIEDTSEILVAAPNVVRFEAKDPVLDPETGAILTPAVTVTQLLKTTLRHRPDRILLGEVRGAEAWDLLMLLSTGHQGSLCTLHANDATMALSRLAMCALQAQTGVSYDHLVLMVRQVIQTVVVIARQDDGARRVREVLRL